MIADIIGVRALALSFWLGAPLAFCLLACRGEVPTTTEPRHETQAPHRIEARDAQDATTTVSDTDSGVASPVVDSQAAAEAEMLEDLAGMVRDSPYAAVIKHIKVKKRRKDNGTDIQTYYARVLDTFRGQRRKGIHYIAIVETGEGAGFDVEPEIVILCQDADGFYWPGVGSIFPSTEATRAVAANAARAAPADQTTFPNCD